MSNPLKHTQDYEQNNKNHPPDHQIISYIIATILGAAGEAVMM